MAVPTQSNSQRLARIAETANDILFSAETVFPFTLFPDTITIDRVKVNIKQRAFFNVGKITSIQIEDILNAEASSGPFLGSIKLWTRFFGEKPLHVNYLRNKDALGVKKILQGYIIARHRGIDCSKIQKDELVPLLLDLGSETASSA